MFQSRGGESSPDRESLDCFESGAIATSEAIAAPPLLESLNLLSAQHSESPAQGITDGFHPIIPMPPFYFYLIYYEI
ncbi:hypothetical protein NG799_14785 [Laspinema sp. D1]|uniref:Uncharacterized protein n=1 Tax=Laspinema palackyanum D2a TaxID=2953684 RepID=A0ABT2MS72_9CYAN|nr:hypothetical protein [Laspinema sp. D2b]MCT7967604.1 hypothetical protein [Laspinema sp. D2a]